MSVLKVSLPIELVNFRVSIPVKSFLNAPALTVYDLHRRLQSLDEIPQGKLYFIKIFVCIRIS